jgi:FMN phosphatase YigB (HAD superfamily)
MIKLIIFDLSGVCFTNEEPPYIKYLCEEYNYKHEEFDNFYQSMLVKAETGKITGEEVWSILIERYNIPKTTNQIVDEMMELKEAKLETLDLAFLLRKNYKVTYLTNYCKLYWDAIIKIFDLSKWFNFGLVSYQIGHRKPSKEGFLALMKKFDAKPKETLFIDDSKSNLAEAEKLGITTLLFTNPSNLRKDLKLQGIKA